jgi:hypothetical protein
MASQVPPYTQSSLVLCKHTDNLYYEAKIIKAYQNKQGEWVYKLHYSGWNSRYDENIKHSDTPSRFMAHTPDNIEMTKQQKESALVLAKIANKKKRRVDASVDEEETISVQSSKAETPQDRPHIIKTEIPSRVMFMLQNVRSVTNLEEKTSADDFFKKYLKDNKGKFGKLYPNHPAAAELVETLTEQLKLDFNMNLLACLTQGELKQCLTIFNKKRIAQGEKELSIEEMKEFYENKDCRLNLFMHPNINFADTYGVLHLVRFLKAVYSWYGTEITPYEKFFVIFFHDLLAYAENFTSEYV